MPQSIPPYSLSQPSNAHAYPPRDPSLPVQHDALFQTPEHNYAQISESVSTPSSAWMHHRESDQGIPHELPPLDEWYYHGYPMQEASKLSRASDKSKALLGTFFELVLPSTLALSSMASPGRRFLHMPLSYLSGRLGRRLTRNVDYNNHPKIQSFRHVFKNPEGDIVNPWNRFLDEVTHHNPSHMLQTFKMSESGLIGRIFQHPRLMQAKLNTSIADAPSIGEALKRGVGGGFRFSLTQRIGLFVVKLLAKLANHLPAPLAFPFKLLGSFLEKWFGIPFQGVRVLEDARMLERL